MKKLGKRLLCTPAPRPNRQPLTPFPLDFSAPLYYRNVCTSV